MTKDERKRLRALAEKSTKVTNWYPHEYEVRGPFHRWFTCSEVDDAYREQVSETRDDCKFASAAMNNLVPLLDEIDRLEAALIGGTEVGGVFWREKALSRQETQK